MLNIYSERRAVTPAPSASAHSGAVPRFAWFSPISVGFRALRGCGKFRRLQRQRPEDSERQIHGAGLSCADGSEAQCSWLPL